MKVERRNNIMQGFQSMVYMDRALYALSSGGTELWRIDINTGKVQSKWKMLENVESGWAYRFLIRCEDKLFLVPYSLNHFLLYDPASELSEKISIPNIDVQYNHQFKFASAFYRNRVIYIIPLCYPALLAIDINNYSVSVHREVCLGTEYLGGEQFSGIYAVVDDKCYLPSAQTNTVIEMDLTSYEVKRHNLGKESAWYGSIAYDGEYFWLTGSKKTITKWSKSKNTVEEHNYPRGFESKDGSYPCFYSFIWERILVLVPKKANMFVLVHLNENKITKYKPENLNSIVDGNYLVCEGEKNSTIFFSDYLTRQIFSMNKDTGEILPIRLRQSELEMFIDQQLDCNFQKKPSDYCEETCGTAIYRTCIYGE